MSAINPLFVIDAEQLLLNRKYDDSIDLCNRGLIEYPEYITAWGILVQSYRKKGDIENAKSTLEKVLKDFPDNIFLNLLKDEIFNEIINTDEINSDISDDVFTVDSLSQNDKDFKRSENISTKDVQIENQVVDTEINIDEISENNDTSENNEISENNDTSKNNEISKNENTKLREEELINVYTDSKDVKTDEKSELVEEIENSQTEEIIEKINNSLKSADLSPVEIIGNAYESFINNLIESSGYSSSGNLSEQLDIIPCLNEIDFINENILSFGRSSFKLFTDFPDLPDIEVNYREEINNPEDIINQIDDDLTELAAKLEIASIPKVKDKRNTEANNDDITSIVSETMAKIYIEQGAFEQAVKAYRELIIQYPEKKEYFTDKINRIISKY